VRWSTIVGLVGDVRDERLEKAPGQIVYYPLRRIASGDDPESVPRNFTLVVKSASDPTVLTSAVRQAIWEIDRDLPVAQVRTMEEVIARSMARTSFTMLLLVIAAAMALLLGAVGLYGVVSYTVSRRTREIGVRMALGAHRGDVTRMVLGEGFLLAALGVGLGLGISFAVTRLISALLFEVSPTDPPTFAAVPVLLTAVALFASYVPARRAAAVEPLEAIRYE
jgi:ABC-type antimicrobial peptide transport system permease subunit